MLICGVGGKDRFDEFFRTRIEAAMIDSDLFAKIAVVSDRDAETTEQLVKNFTASFSPIISQVQNNQWMINTYQNSFQQAMVVEFLLVVIPFEQAGALETLLLKVISENIDDRILVERHKAYVEEIMPLAGKYLAKNRLKIKACLGVTWAIQSPEKVFDFIDTQIQAVNWEDSDVLAICFEQLKKI